MSELNYLEFGGPSHSGEYTVFVAGHNHENFIPRSVEQRIAQNLGPEWDVSNRGTRIEIFSKKFFYGYRDDAHVLKSVTDVIGEVKVLGTGFGVKFALPMLRILQDNDGDVAFLECAILAETPDHWTVKPVEKPHYDADSADINARFHHAWMRVAKNDGSAELIDSTFDVATLSTYEAREVGPLLSEMWRKSERTR